MATSVDTARAVGLQRTACSHTPIADFIFKRPAREVIVEIGKRRLGDVGERLFRQKCLMRRDDDVRQRNEQRKRLVLERHVGAVFVKPFALLLIDIESGRADRPLTQGGQKCLAVDQTAARRVDERDTRLDFGQRFGIDKMLQCCPDFAEWIGKNKNA